ncbi:hypothetical protein ILYODFUR_029489 [Ilyodon furcidens]|uniref:Uncharacterized protein n=1 Tax=Ilyodon furcidens TaxID=33524 RepID=A0ABV0T195_9TELE
MVIMTKHFRVGPIRPQGMSQKRRSLSLRTFNNCNLAVLSYFWLLLVASQPMLVQNFTVDNDSLTSFNSFFTRSLAYFLELIRTCQQQIQHDITELEESFSLSGVATASHLSPFNPMFCISFCHRMETMIIRNSIINKQAQKDVFGEQV